MNLPATAQSKVCTTCKEDKALSEFYPNGNATYSKCKECHKQTKRNDRKKNPEKDKYYRIKHKYGLEAHQYDAMLEATPHCPICGSEEPLVVDHDHSTSKVRGLICQPCNLLLGFAKDNIETLNNAIKYLEQ